MEVSGWGLAYCSWFDIVFALWYTHAPNFGSLSWFWLCKEQSCPLSPHLGLWRMLGVPDWGLASWSWFGYGHWTLVHLYSEFWLPIMILKVQRTSMSFKSWFGALETWEVPDLGLASWSWFGYGSWSFIRSWFEFWLSILILKVQRTCMSFKSWFGDLEDFGCSWLGFGILILIWIWSLFFYLPIFQILALYIYFEGAKNIHAL